MICKLHRAVALAVLAALALMPQPLRAGGPGAAIVGTPCFCAAVCHGKGQGPQSWTDPAGAQVSLSQCPPARPEDVAAQGRICPCGNPQDWYKLWSQLNPPQPNRTSPNH